MSLCRSQFELDHKSQFITTNTSKAKGIMKYAHKIHYSWWLRIKLNIFIQHIRYTFDLLLTDSMAAAVAITLVQSWLDYANAIMYRTALSNIHKLQHAQAPEHNDSNCAMTRIVLPNIAPSRPQLSYVIYTGCRSLRVLNINYKSLSVA